MSKLLANRWFRWTLLTIALSGLGIGIYRFTPPEPMWEKEASKKDVALEEGELANHYEQITNDFASRAGSDGSVEINNRRTGKTVKRFEKPASDWGYLLNNGNVLEGLSGGKNRKWRLWDFNTQKRIAEVDLGPNDYVLDFVHDRYFAVRRISEKTPRMDLCEWQSGRSVLSVPDVVPAKVISPDDRYIAITRQTPVPALELFELSSRRSVWKFQRSDVFLPMAFGGDSETLFAWQPDPSAMFAYECATGKQLLQLPLPRSAAFNTPTVVACPDHSNILVFQLDGKLPARSNMFWEFIRAWIPGMNERQGHSTNDVAMVLNATTGAIRFRIDGWNITSAKLSNDGNTLLTNHHDAERQLIRSWNVNAWKPLHWAVGVPAGLAAMIVLHSVWRARRRAMPTSASDSAA